MNNNRFDNNRIRKNIVNEEPKKEIRQRPQKTVSKNITVTLEESKLEEFKNICYEIGTTPATKARELIYIFIRDNL